MIQPPRPGRAPFPGRPPGPVPGADVSSAASGTGAGDAATPRAALVADLEQQRQRLAALAGWLLEQGLAGEAVAATHIADALASNIAALAA